MMLPNIQGGATKASPTPPIPAMDQAAPAPPATAATIRQEVRDIAKQARQAALDAKAQAKADAKLAANQTTTSTAPPNNLDLVPQGAVDIATGFFVMVAVCVVGFPLARAFARMMDRRGTLPAASGPDLRPQIQQLQESVDAMAIELERISEGQRFTTKVLTERSGSAS